MVSLIQLVLPTYILLFAILVVCYYKRRHNRTLRRMSERHTELFDLAIKRKENIRILREEKEKLEKGNRGLRTENKELRLENNKLKFQLKREGGLR